MTASPPKVNGHTRPPAPPVLGDWQPIEATPSAETDNGASWVDTAPVETPVDSELVAQAKAEAIRAKAWADAEEQRLRAEAEADAIRAKAEEEARRLRLNNDKLERKAREDEAATEARIAESRKRKADADRAREEADRLAAEQQQAEESAAAEVAQADDRWRRYALTFYVVCAIVALPVQVAAFWSPRAPWLIAAPLMLEGGAWVVLKGAAAAVASRRPHWHYRLIAWMLAAIAAGINLWHGLNAFDPATAIGTAFASIAGPGVWDLHEHGRIRKRDGVLTRKEHKAQRKAEQAEAARKAAEEKRRAAEKEAADKAAAEKLATLTELRKTHFQKVWEHAVRLAADLGEVDPNAVWERAKFDVEGTKPGESAEVLRMRNAASARVEAAREKRSVNGSTQQVASHLLPTRKTRVYNPPARAGRRTKGDSPKFSEAARRQASIAAKNARQKDPS